VNIFVSRPTWVSSEFEEGLSTFMVQLGNLGLVPRTLGVTDYPSKAPLDEVIAILKSCQGAVVLGYPQLEVQSGILKGKNLTEPLSLATEWNHLEAALAYSMEIPLLIIHHETIGRGIFDRGVLNAFLHEVDLTSPTWSMQQALNGAIKSWKEACVQKTPNYVDVRKSIHPTKSSKTPVCPNCSTGIKSAYLSPIPRDFVELEGAEWECPQCQFKE